MKKFLKLFLFFILPLSAFAISFDPSNSAIAFDFGGVVAKNDKASVAEFLSKELSISMHKAETILSDLTHARKKGKRDEEFWREYRSNHKNLLATDWEAKFALKCSESVKFIPGTLEIVKALKLKGYKVALLSNLKNIEGKVLCETKISDLFDIVLLSTDIKVEKPDRRAYEILLERLKVGSKNCIFIDDKIRNVRGARLLGIEGILFTSPEALKVELERRNIKLS